METKQIKTSNAGSLFEKVFVPFLKWTFVGMSFGCTFHNWDLGYSVFIACVFLENLVDRAVMDLMKDFS